MSLACRFLSAIAGDLRRLSLVLDGRRPGYAEGQSATLLEEAVVARAWIWAKAAHDVSHPSATLGVAKEQPGQQG